VNRNSIQGQQLVASQQGQHNQSLHHDCLQLALRSSFQQRVNSVVVPLRLSYRRRGAEYGRIKVYLFHLAQMLVLAPNGFTLIDMENEEKNNTKGGFYGCWVGSCLGSVTMFLLSMALMVLFRGKPPFNEIDLVFYLFIGLVAGGVLGFILYAAKKRRH
jgi:hypothetical protein